MCTEQILHRCDIVILSSSVLLSLASNAGSLFVSSITTKAKNGTYIVFQNGLQKLWTKLIVIEFFKIAIHLKRPNIPPSRPCCNIFILLVHRLLCNLSFSFDRSYSVDYLSFLSFPLLWLSLVFQVGSLVYLWNQKTRSIPDLL